VESAAHAAVAAAILPANATEDVSIRPLPMKPSLFEPALGEAPQAELPTPATFIPPAPERTARTPRMPRIDELPLPAQNEIRAQRGELAGDHPEQRRMSLMQRLASVGLGRRADHTEPPLAPRTAQAMPQFERPLRPTARQPEGRPDDPVSEYARRSGPQGLDPHGRPAPVHNSAEEDQLDIPAFLRRQAN
jgi:cell division protein FtsZ